jgi:hypothetical protein
MLIQFVETYDRLDVLGLVFSKGNYSIIPAFDFTMCFYVGFSDGERFFNKTHNVIPTVTIGKGLPIYHPSTTLCLSLNNPVHTMAVPFRVIPSEQSCFATVAQKDFTVGEDVVDGEGEWEGVFYEGDHITFVVPTGVKMSSRVPV